MTSHLRDIAAKARNLAAEIWKDILERLDELSKRLRSPEEEEEEDKDGIMFKSIQCVKTKFEHYMTQLPILGFNSAR